jgi:hypothetical protein
LLQQYPAQADKEKEGWCSIHQCQMTQHHNAKGSWWSHKTTDGWCHGNKQ